LNDGIDPFLREAGKLLKGGVSGFHTLACLLDGLQIFVHEESDWQRKEWMRCEMSPK
jgi:hypothetical protein